MKINTKIALILVALALILFCILGIIKLNNQERGTTLNKVTHTLTTYTGIGAYVYKHGTIVKVVDGQPVVVGSFHDDSGKDYPGTVEIKEVK